MKHPSSQAILLVDGYNIIGAWPNLVSLRDGQGLAAAREHLAESLANYSAHQEYETWLVFDAYGQSRPKHTEPVTQNLSLHYTASGQTADTYIEIACAKFRTDARKFRHRLIVATSDRAQQLTVVGYGAEWMSALQLANEVIDTGQRIRQRQKPAKKSQSRFLASGLSPEMQAKLTKLRMGLTD
ncbi:MAG: NYN domain-containing protein [Cyanobacteria bacterium J06648_16]